MFMTIYIMPHERADALEAYEKWLTDDQRRIINEADEDAVIELKRKDDVTQVTIVHANVD